MGWNNNSGILDSYRIVSRTKVVSDRIALAFRRVPYGWLKALRVSPPYEAVDSGILFTWPGSLSLTHAVAVAP